MTLAVRVPASTSNLGAGFDCLGLALDIWLEARLGARAASSQYEGTLAGLTPDEDIIHRILAERGVIEHRALVVHSGIPVGKGLGSSAAATVAGLALAQLAEGEPLDRDRLFDEAADLEGHPDNAGPAVYGGLILAANRPTSIPFHDSLGIALAVPAEAISTEEARALLPSDVSRVTAIGQAKRAAALVRGLGTGDPELIGFGMDDWIAVPHRRDLIAGYDTAVDAGLTAGAYGVTISGAGSALLAIGPKGKMAMVAGAMAGALGRAGKVSEAMVPDVAPIGMKTP